MRQHDVRNKQADPIDTFRKIFFILLPIYGYNQLAEYTATLLGVLQATTSKEKKTHLKPVKHGFDTKVSEVLVTVPSGRSFQSLLVAGKNNRLCLVHGTGSLRVAWIVLIFFFFLGGGEVGIGLELSATKFCPRICSDGRTVPK